MNKTDSATKSYQIILKCQNLNLRIGTGVVTYMLPSAGTNASRGLMLLMGIAAEEKLGLRYVLLQKGAKKAISKHG